MVIDGVEINFPSLLAGSGICAYYPGWQGGKPAAELTVSQPLLKPDTFALGQIGIKDILGDDRWLGCTDQACRARFLCRFPS